MVKPNEKGGEFERLVCKRLSQWVLPGSDRTLFWRSSMSGGRATVRRNMGKAAADQSSDLSAVAPEGNALCSVFTIECKHVKDLRLASAFVKGQGDMVTFWRQVCREAAHTGKRPLLIARQNAWPVLALLRSQDFHFFGAISGQQCARVYQLTSRPSEVSVFTLDGLLSHPYKEERFRGVR